MNIIGKSERGFPILYTAAALISLLLSAWTGSQNSIINSDGVLYIQSAGMFSDGNWADGYAMYPWPLYSALIALVHAITGARLEPAAQLVNAGFDALTVITFIALVRLLDADRKTLLIATGVILAHPYINEVRAFIIRDHGYWAMYLCSLYLIVRWIKKPSIGLAIAWGSSVLAASLFRIEGFALILLGLAALSGPGLPARQRLTRTGMLITIPLVMIALLYAVAALLVSQDTVLASRLTEPLVRLQDFWHGLSTGFADKAGVMREAVLNQWSDQYAVPGLFATLGIIFFHRLLITLTPVYSVLLLLPGLRARFRPDKPIRRILQAATVLQLVVVFVFLVPSFFLSSRFLIPLVLTLLLAIPFALAALHDAYLSSRVGHWVRKGAVVTLIFVVLSSIDGVVSLSPDRQSTLQDAGLWLQENTPETATLYTNNHKISYYAHRKIRHQARSRWDITPDLLQHTDWRRFDVVALWSDNDAAPLESLARQSGLRELRRFSGTGLDTVIIYRPERGARNPQ